MKNHLRNLTLSTLAFALAPLAQANAVTIFDSAATAWTGESSLSTTASGSSTFNFPTTNFPTNPTTFQGADYYSLPSAITTGSGVWTFNTTATFNIPTTANHDFINISVGFGNYVTTTDPVSSSGVASANGTGGPWIADQRQPLANGSLSAALHGGSGTTHSSPTFLIDPFSSPEFGHQHDPLQLKLVLDTTNPQWTVSQFVDGVLYESYAYVTNPTATGIGVGAQGANLDPTSVTFSNTTLTDDVTAAVPEPSTWAMMMLGFAGLGFLAYRRKDRKGGLNFRLA